MTVDRVLNFVLLSVATFFLLQEFGPKITAAVVALAIYIRPSKEVY